MGVKAISLPDELIMELELAAEKGSRGFSAEVRMRIERDRLREALADPPLGLDGVVATKEISGKNDPNKETENIELVTLDEFRARVEDSEKIEGRILSADEIADGAVIDDVIERAIAVGYEPSKVELDASVGKEDTEKWPIGGMVEPVKEPFRNVIEEGIRGKAKKLTEGIPGVFKAVDLGKVEVPGFGVTDAKYVIPDKKLDGEEAITKTLANETGMPKPSKKNRLKEAGNDQKPFEMVKGFYRERFSSIVEAETEAKKLGWSPGEYKIEDVIG